MAIESEAFTKPSVGRLWWNPRVRSLIFQAIVLLGLAAFVGYIVHNTIENLKALSIASGFDFLGSTAGFSIHFSLISYSEIDTYGRAFLVGLLNTILVSSLGIVACTIVGFIIGIARLSHNWLVARLATVYIETTRNVPLLLQIFLWYFGVLSAMPQPRQSVSFFDTLFLNNRGLYMPSPILEPGFWFIPGSLALGVVIVVFLVRWARRRREATGKQFHTVYVSAGILVGLPLIATLATGVPLTWSFPALKGFNFVGGTVLIPELVALWLALSIYTAAFVAEIVRAGILSVGKGQTEAAHALGLSRGKTLQLVIVPQAMRVIVPPLTNQYLNLTKNSSLAAAIGYPDLVSVFAGTVLNQTGQAVEVIAITMAVYLTISLSISLFMNWYNRHIALVER